MPAVWTPDGQALAVVGALETISVTPVVDADPDYSDGDVLGSVMEFANAVRMDGGSGYVTSVRITSKTANAQPVDLLLFSADPTNTTWTDNAAVAVNAADLAFLVGVVPVNSWHALGTPSVGYKECGVPFKLASGTSLWGVLIARGTVAIGAVDDVVVEIGLDQN